MKHLTILMPDTHIGFNTFACVIGAYDIFRRADQYWQGKGRPSLFTTIELAGVSAVSAIQDGLLTMKPDVSLSAIHKTDLIIIPAINHRFIKPLKCNTELTDWIIKQYKNGAEVASMCTGAMILASTGLLDGKNCSIHWSAAEQLKELFPKVRVKADNLITDEQGIYTNGGGYSFLNLVIYLIEKYYDRETAIYCSKIFQIEIDRQRQAVFAIFKGQKSHDDALIKQVQIYMETHFQDRISMEELAKQFAIGRRNFDRRFIKATGNTPVEYLQRVKIESAKKAFETTRKHINEVMYEAGYSDEKAFREVFRKITGMSPLDYKKKYNKETVLKY